MTDQEIRERREKIRVIATEIFMFIAAVALVIFLTLIVMGYNFSFKRIGTEEEVIQRSGLVQVSSKPSGAAILVDGNSSLLLRTNGSRTAAAGEHEISLIKEGYSEWKKTITVNEGLMYRLNYPRLFPLERDEELALDVANVKFLNTSEDGEKLVYLKNKHLFYVDLNSAKLNEKALLEGVEFEAVSEVKWSKNGARMLARFDGKYGMIVFKSGKAELVDLSAYLEETSQGIRFETEAGDRILFLKNGELRELDLLSKSINLVVMEKVVAFDNVGDKIFYVTDSKEEGIQKFKAIRVGETDGVVLNWGFRGEETQVAVTEYFEEFYFGVSGISKQDGGESKNYLDVFKFSEWPEEGLDFSEMNPEEVKEFAGEISEPGNLEKKGGGMVFVVDGKGQKIVYDIESGKLTEFGIEGEENGWVDEFLRYEIKDGALWVADYDGNNWTQIMDEGVTGGLVRISANNKYIYYIKEKDLYRQKI